MKKKNLRQATVVVTGATSGIGRAIALEFAKQGANLVLAARNESNLLEMAQECMRLGAHDDSGKVSIDPRSGYGSRRLRPDSHSYAHARDHRRSSLEQAKDGLLIALLFRRSI